MRVERGWVLASLRSELPRAEQTQNLLRDADVGSYVYVSTNIRAERVDLRISYALEMSEAWSVRRQSEFELYATS
jgi:hypothetical protein